MKDNRLCCLPEEILHQSLQREEKAQQTEGSLKKQEYGKKTSQNPNQAKNNLQIYSISIIFEV